MAIAWVPVAVCNMAQVSFFRTQPSWRNPTLKQGMQHNALRSTPANEPNTCARNVHTSAFATCYRVKLKEYGFQPEKVAELVSRTFNEMVFIHGDVHCDPHAANLFLRKNPVDGSMQLVLLDHGLYRYVSHLPMQNFIYYCVPDTSDLLLPTDCCVLLLWLLPTIALVAAYHRSDCCLPPL